MLTEEERINALLERTLAKYSKADLASVQLSSKTPKKKPKRKKPDSSVERPRRPRKQQKKEKSVRVPVQSTEGDNNVKEATTKENDSDEDKTGAQDNNQSDAMEIESTNDKGNKEDNEHEAEEKEEKEESIDNDSKDNKNAANADSDEKNEQDESAQDSEGSEGDKAEDEDEEDEESEESENLDDSNVNYHKLATKKRGFKKKCWHTRRKQTPVSSQQDEADEMK